MVLDCLQGLKFHIRKGLLTPDARVFRVMRISPLLCRCLKGKTGGCLRPSIITPVPLAGASRPHMLNLAEDQWVGSACLYINYASCVPTAALGVCL